MVPVVDEDGDEDDDNGGSDVQCSACLLVINMLYLTNFSQQE